MKMHWYKWLLVVFTTTNVLSVGAVDVPSDAKIFLSLFQTSNTQEKTKALEAIDRNWASGYEFMVLETAYLIDDEALRIQLMEVLKKKTGQSFSDSFNDWYFWLWQRDIQEHESYPIFKAELYKLIDPKFEKYFLDRYTSTLIKWNEIRWGGVKQDGIPPLRQPEMIGAEEAEYLGNYDVVFGVEINGDVRAYPKRILAWHELFIDEIGGVQVAGVYCTLCGSVIIYNTTMNGENHQMGTSGFLYRSNKLMYDKATQSLWSTLQGKPVVGPLVDQDIALQTLSVVTTTWGEWKKRHPETSVLSLNTGYDRNYNEGVAYESYFSTDAVLFNTPVKDNRLKNKEEVLALRSKVASEPTLAISTQFLKKNNLYLDQVGTQEIVVLTDKTGANRVFETTGIHFVKYDKKQTVVDANGASWQVNEEYLVGPHGQQLARLPYHRVFWFGWVAAFPNTRLVK